MPDLTSLPQAAGAAQQAPSKTSAATPQAGTAEALSGQQNAVAEFVNGTQVLTMEDYRALQSRQSQLSSQLSLAEQRASRILNSLADAPPEAKAGMQERLKVLQDRIVQIETDLAVTGRQLASVPPQVRQAYIAQGEARPFVQRFPQPDQMTAIVIVAIIFVFTPLAFALARSIWKRASRPRITVHDAEAAQRLARIEQSMDAIAIEVERVSEGQRFLTNLLARERQPVPIAAEARSDAENTAQPT